MLATNQFRKGAKVEIDGTPFEIVDFQHVSPGKGSAFTRTKLRNMLNQNVIERTYKSGEKLPKANTMEVEMQYLFKDSAGFHFMNMTTYEQIAITEEQLGSHALGYLKEEMIIKVMLFNDRPIGVELPNFVELKVVETEPTIKGATATGMSKPAKLETGASVPVPGHIKEGDIIKVDTRDDRFVQKVNR